MSKMPPELVDPRGEVDDIALELTEH